MTTPAKKPSTVGINYFKFSGECKKKEFSYSKNGKPFCTISVLVPAKNEKYANTFRLKAFDEMAETLDKDIAEGGKFSFNGYVRNGSYVDKEGKKVWTTDFFINGFEPATDQE